MVRLRGGWIVPVGVLASVGSGVPGVIGELPWQPARTIAKSAARRKGFDGIRDFPHVGFSPDFHRMPDSSMSREVGQAPLPRFRPGSVLNYYFHRNLCAYFILAYPINDESGLARRGYSFLSRPAPSSARSTAFPRRIIPLSPADRGGEGKCAAATARGASCRNWAWLPESRTSGTPQPRNSGGRV